MPHAVFVVPLWIAVFLLFSIASPCYAVAAWKTRSPSPRSATWLNPLTMTIALCLAASPFAQIAPWFDAMSTNIVHANFFTGVAGVPWNAASHPLPQA